LISVESSGSWQALYASWRDSSWTNKEKGDAFERLTQKVLQRHPEYQTKLRNVWLLSEVPPKQRQLLNLPNQDEGIDLVAETFDGDYWAIQCKFKSDPASAVTRTELSTFSQLAFVHCKTFSFGLVFHTSDHPIRKLGLLGSIGARGKEFFDQLDEADWVRIVSETPERLRPRLPRQHQKDAVREASKYFLKDGRARGKLIMPCGTGKSLTAFWIAEALEAKAILVAVPSLSLIKQSISDWTREFVARGTRPDWLVVCSDESAARREKDEFTESIGELGIDATTNPGRIQAFLKKRSEVRIVFSTYQSGNVLAREALKQKFSFDLGIFDEAHRTVGIEDKLFSHLLSDRNISIKRRLFMTATERVVRGSKDDVYSMDDQAVYGDCMYQMTFKQAIEADPPIICDYKIVTVSVTDAEVQEMIHNKHFVSVEGMKDDQRSDALVAAVAISKVIRKYKTKHLISFHRSIEAADSFRELQSQVFQATRQKIGTFHISSKKSTGDRASLIKEFRDAPRALITNARCLQEGVDIPAVDAVVFADPKQSVVDIVQAAGRAMRRFDGKEFGLIVLPLPVPDKVDPEVFFEGTEFRQVARVITALSTQDQRIAEEFRVVEQQPRSKSKIVELDFDLPLTEKISLEDFSKKVYLKVWEKVGRANWRPFEEARVFVRKLGLETSDHYSVWAKSDLRPFDIPLAPQAVYSEFLGWADWLGSRGKPTHLEWRSFEEARAYVREHKLASSTEWRAWVKTQRRPVDIPVSPDHIYPEFKNWGDWLGTQRKPRYAGEWRPFNQAREYVRNLALATSQDYRKWAKGSQRPADIPATPHFAYSEWVSWPDWLGNGNRGRGDGYLAYEDGRAVVRAKGFRSSSQYLKWAKSGSKPHNIPASPHSVYANWAGWADWLGPKWMDFLEARRWARGLGLKSAKEWYEYSRSHDRPTGIPSNPPMSYQEHWKGWEDWLAFDRSRQEKFLSFCEARRIARGLGLRSQSEYLAWWKEHGEESRLPNSVTQVYKSEWKSWADWLGFDRWRSFSNAREFVRGLGLKSINEWRAFTKTREFPRDIPKAPEQAAVYADQWISYSDWLGKE